MNLPSHGSGVTESKRLRWSEVSSVAVTFLI
jgi:hypothetical protein